jgi:hypothetical protein
VRLLPDLPKGLEGEPAEPDEGEGAELVEGSELGEVDEGTAGG